jgi:hypothetical protein
VIGAPPQHACVIRESWHDNPYRIIALTMLAAFKAAKCSDRFLTVIHRSYMADHRIKAEMTSRVSVGAASVRHQVRNLGGFRMPVSTNGDARVGTGVRKPEEKEPADDALCWCSALYGDCGLVAAVAINNNRGPGTFRAGTRAVFMRHKSASEVRRASLLLAAVPIGNRSSMPVGDSRVVSAFRGASVRALMTCRS